MSEPPTWEEHFRAHLVRLRDEAGMSQSDLARAMKERGFAWHQQTAARVEAGDRPLRLNEAAALAGFFGKNLDVLTQPEHAAGEVTFTRAPVLLDLLRAERDERAAAREIESLRARLAELEAVHDQRMKHYADAEDRAAKAGFLSLERRSQYEALRRGDDGEHPATP